MPIIYPNDERLPDARFDGSTTFGAYLSVRHDLSADFHGSTHLFPELVPGVIFLEATFSGSTDFAARLIEGPMAAEFAGSTTFTAAFRAPTPESWTFQLFIDHIPLIPASRYIRFLPRVKADGVEVPIVSWSVTDPDTTSAMSLQFKLARIADRDLFGPDTQIDFGLGLRTAGVWDEDSFVLKMNTSQFQSKEITVQWGENQPGDEVTVNVISKTTNKFLVSAETDLVIYDPHKVGIAVNDFEAIIDTEGRIYPTELKGIANMTVYDLLHEVLVVRCGFTGYHTNLPNWPVARVDVQFTETIWNSIAGIIGMFTPVVFERDDVVWILDTTQVLPAGFPAPREVVISEYQHASVTDNRDRLDALLILYAEDSLGYDFITTRTEESTTELGGNTVFVQRLFKEFRRNSQPNVIVREQMYHEERNVSNGFVGTIQTSVEDFTYDSQNKLTLRNKAVDARVPDLNNSGTLTVLRTQEETETWQYAAHPFQPRRMFVQNRLFLTQGLIAVDANNQQLGVDFERDIQNSYRSGNVDTGMTSRFGDIRSRIETGEPQRDGTVKTTVIDVDELQHTVVVDYAQAEPGDISVNGMTPAQKRVLVFDDENTLRARDHVERLNVGELPTIYAIPLARRILKLRKLKAGLGPYSIIGYDESLHKGSVVELKFRDGVSLGTFIITGRNPQGSLYTINTSFTAKKIG